MSEAEVSPAAAGTIPHRIFGGFWHITFFFAAIAFSIARSPRKIATSSSLSSESEDAKILPYQ